MAVEFFVDVLKLDYRACFVSDESCLSNLSFCGMPEDIAPPEAELAALYTGGDQWVLTEIERRYGLKLHVTRINLVDLFSRPMEGRGRRLH